MCKVHCDNVEGWVTVTDIAGRTGCGGCRVSPLSTGLLWLVDDQAADGGAESGRNAVGTAGAWLGRAWRCIMGPGRGDRMPACGAWRARGDPDLLIVVGAADCAGEGTHTRAQSGADRERSLRVCVGLTICVCMARAIRRSLWTRPYWASRSGMRRGFWSRRTGCSKPATVATTSRANGISRAYRRERISSSRSWTSCAGRISMAMPR